MLRANLSTLLMVLFLTSSFPTLAAAGAGSSGGGADTPAPGTGAAWFIGQGKEIKVCIDVAPDFGMPAGTTPENMIQTVFKNWQTYVDSRQIENGRSPQLKLVFNLDFVSSCNEQHDLAFYFGVSNPAVAQAKTQFNDPMAFSWRQTFNAVTGWGTGFVWVQSSDPTTTSQPLWQDPLRLQAILMHEVGHVLGCNHVAGTVMDAGIAYVINDSVATVLAPTSSETRAQYFANNIDGSNQLAWCVSCTNAIRGEIGVPKRFESSPGFDPKITFKKFMGRAPVGDIQATFQMSLNANNDQHPFKSLRVTYKDQIGSKVIPFIMRSTVIGLDQGNDAAIFSVYAGSNPNGGTSASPFMGAVLEGYVKDASGTLTPITIAINASGNYSWIQIDYDSNLVDLPLFRAPQPPEM